ncbi:MAG TPA: RecQ family ATP-dependent DNA helicase [Myxococcales bacterium]|nr:RecQ family ATP-dependent DNA helicase [Myxococcales bacterium]
MQELREALSTHFGYGGFRPGQEAIIQSVLSGRPTLAILPTGGGKSLCFQLPALLLEGTTVVASPLVALMKDQVDALTVRGIPATFVNSSLSEAERKERQARIRAGAYRLVYVAPERFRSGSFREAIAQVRVPLFAIDEAHCISSWGHDFRPDYLKLAEACGHLRAERVLALTATATPEVRKDIVRALGLDDPQVFVAGFDRPNLFVEVARASGDQEKVGRILALARRGGPGLVYAATRRNVEKVVLALRANGVDAAGYHAGMDDAERSATQESFLRGEVSVVVATNAFGMGVDKADIRFVAHFHVPRSIEAYYQEIGRAGRDGAPSLALLLFNYADVMLQKRMIEGSRPKEETVRKIWDAARGLGSGGAAQLAAVCGVHPADAQAAVKLLESAGHLARRGQDFSVVTPEVEEPAVDFEIAAMRVAHERQMLDRMVRFCDTEGCRRRNLLRYFGDPDAPRSCSACDCCAGQRAPAAEEVSLDRQRRLPGPPRAVEIPADMDEEVFAALRALRTEIARETRVPPYVVFHDSTLRELASALPQDERGFLAVKGAGPSRWQRYGERVLAVTRKGRHSRTTPPDAAQEQTRRAAGTETDQAPAPAYGDVEVPPPPEPPMARDPAGASDLDTVWQLCAGGATLAEIADRTRIAVPDVARRLCELRRAGRDLDVGRLLGQGRVEAIRLAARGANGDVAAVRRRLPFTAPLAEIRLALEA